GLIRRKRRATINPTGHANAWPQRQTEFICRLTQALGGLQTGVKPVPLLLRDAPSKHLQLQPDPDTRMRGRRVRLAKLQLSQKINVSSARPPAMNSPASARLPSACARQKI